MLLLFRRTGPCAARRRFTLLGDDLFGFITNRLNVSMTGMEAGSGTHYVPQWTEIVVTLSVIALGFAIFRLVAGQLPIFAAEADNSRQALRSRTSASEEPELVRTG